MKAAKTNTVVVVAEPHELVAPLVAREDVIRAITEIDQTEAWIGRQTAQMHQEVAQLTAEYSDRCAPAQKIIATQRRAVEEWATVNRKSLLAGVKGKTVEIGPHKLGWRGKPARVVLHATLDAILAVIKKKRWTDTFVRTKQELNKEALLNDPDRAARIEGVEIVRDEESFFVQPFGNAATSGREGR